MLSKAASACWRISLILAGYDEGVYTYIYESFDKKGNWTKKFGYLDGEIECLITREIKY
jgi:hypothetical protein